METITIHVQKRESLGSKATRVLRKEGFVPGVLYGHGEKNVSLALCLAPVCYSSLRLSFNYSLSYSRKDLSF